VFPTSPLLYILVCTNSPSSLFILFLPQSSFHFFSARSWPFTSFLLPVFSKTTCELSGNFFFFFFSLQLTLSAALPLFQLPSHAFLQNQSILYRNPKAPHGLHSGLPFLFSSSLVFDLPCLGCFLKIFFNPFCGGSVFPLSFLTICKWLAFTQLNPALVLYLFPPLSLLVQSPLWRLAGPFRSPMIRV